MNKAWYQSKTIWGGIVTLLAVAAGAFGYSVGAEDQAQLIELVSTIGGSVGGILAIYGRVVSDSRIK